MIRRNSASLHVGQRIGHYTVVSVLVNGVIVSSNPKGDGEERRFVAQTTLAGVKKELGTMGLRAEVNPLVAFQTRSGKPISFDAKHRNPPRMNGAAYLTGGFHFSRGGFTSREAAMHYAQGENTASQRSHGVTYKVKITKDGAGYSVYFGPIFDASKANPRRRRNGTTAGEMAAGRSMAYTRLFRNGAAKVDAYVPAYLSVPRHGENVILARHPSDAMPTMVGIGNAPTAFQRKQYAGCTLTVVPASSVKRHRIGG